MAQGNPYDTENKIEYRLHEIEQERTQLLQRLKQIKETSTDETVRQLGRSIMEQSPEAPAKKIELFLKLFRCRESVFPKLWENKKKGTKGYSPVCRNEWAPGVCHKPQVKCANCEHRSFYPLNEEAVDAHLRGQMTIGTYAIRDDDTCIFIACDLDEKSWLTDVECYRTVAEGMGIQVGVERSRSGNGAHAWIFFSEPVPALRILFQQCGPIRHEIKNADGGKLEKNVIFTETGFRLPEQTELKPAYHVLAHYLTTDPKRNALIAKDAIEALHAGRFLLLISDRKDHLEILAALIEKSLAERLGDYSEAFKKLRVFRLDGELSSKARAQVLSDVKSARTEGLAVAILATASLIGEGFDLPALDTLILAMPLSFKGRMVQYTGRLHRLAEGKTSVVVHDYVDSSSAIFLKMYLNRVKAYHEMGYKIEEPVGLMGPRSLRASRQTPLFGRGLE